MAESLGGRVVVLSPHLDDAVLSAWHVLRRPGEVQVVNVCSGVSATDLLSPWDRLTGATSSRSRMLERLQEDREALARAGREAISLDFPEAQYRDGPLEPEALRTALERTVGGASEVWAPAGIGGHDDHLQLRNAALEFMLGGGPPLQLYADLPYATRFGWPGWVTNEEDDPHLMVELWWRRFLPSRVGLQPARHVLSADEVERKLDALSAYRTQLPGLNGGQLGLVQRSCIIRYEVSWSASADPT